MSQPNTSFSILLRRLKTARESSVLLVLVVIGIGLYFSTAKDHFSATIRKHPSFDLWSWAVEWNKSYRIVGFFGQEIPAREALAALPSLEITSIAESETRWVRYRVDTPLKAEEDMLFFWQCAD